MGVNEVLDRATVSLHGERKRADIVGFFGYLAHAAGMTIDYSFEKDCSFGSPGSNVELMRMHPRLRSLKVEGRIYDPVPCESDSFQSVPPEVRSSASGISALRFNLIPGYKRGEYRPTILTLWDRVNQLAREYFTTELTDSRVDVKLRFPSDAAQVEAFLGNLAGKGLDVRVSCSCSTQFPPSLRDRGGVSKIVSEQKYRGVVIDPVSDVSTAFRADADNLAPFVFTGFRLGEPWYRKVEQIPPAELALMERIRSVAVPTRTP